MAIEQGNIVYVESQVMDDVPEGGGAASNRVIVDGAMNNIFPDISDLDRGTGRIKLRKMYCAVRSLSTDLFGGVKTVLTALPDDPALGYTIFSTDNAFDTRADVAARVEAYLTAGPEWGGYLLEDHIAGQGTVQLFQRPSAALPLPGQTLVLIQDEGKTSEKRQYVRVIRVTPTERTFTYSTSGGYVDYQGVVVACELSDVLRYDFAGSPPSRTFARDASKTKLRDTVVADAARYYGATPLKASSAVGDLNIDVDSIWSQLVPSAQSELALTDATPNGELVALMATSSDAITMNTSAAFSPTASLYVGPLLPGSLAISAGAVTLTDKNGKLMAGSTEVGSVDYANGVLAIAASGPSYSGAKTITLRPAASPQVTTETWSQPVTAESRSATLAFTLVPVPAPGTLQLSYMAQGRWYTLRDQGTGSLAGADASHGVGQLSFITGSLSVTLGALPDVGGEILLGWSVPQLTAQRLVPQGITGVFEIELGGPVWPGSLSITWDADSPRVVTDDGAGVLTGSGSGTIDYATGSVRLTPLVLMSPGMAWHASWSDVAGDIRPPVRASVADFTDAGTAWHATLADAAVQPDTFSAEVSLRLAESGATSVWAIQDDGAGGIFVRVGDDLVPLVGASINYGTGVVTLDKDGDGQLLPVGWSRPEVNNRSVVFGAA
ncbi:hypothetical protein ACTSKR_11290 [Chitinibacteraceae bacterium HSL-7]